jgi:uncharacterized repeat protein (TIGR02543 family)
LARNLLRTEALPNDRDGRPIADPAVILFSAGYSTTVVSDVPVVGYTTGTFVKHGSAHINNYFGAGLDRARKMANVIKLDTEFSYTTNNVKTTYTKHRADIYTVGWRQSPSITNLKNVYPSTPGHAYEVNNRAEVIQVFETLANKFTSTSSSTSQTNAWFVTDPMGANIEFATAIPSSDISSGLLRFENNTLHWNLKAAYPTSVINNIYTYNYQYKIKLDNTGSGFAAGVPYPTNGTTTLDYDMLVNGVATGNVAKAHFAVPAVKGFAGGLNFTKVGGGAVNLAGCEFSLANQAKTSHTMAAVSATGSGAVDFPNIPSGHTYVLRETFMPDQYKGLYLQNNETLTVAVSYGDVTIRDSQGNIVSGGFKFDNPGLAVAEVITGDPEDVTSNSASIVDNSYSGITGNINFVAVQYSTSPAMASPVTVRAASVTNPYSVGLTGLTPDTTYYYRAGVNAASGSHFGVVKSFTTDALAFDVKYLANGGAGEYADPGQSALLPYTVKGLSDTGISFENHSFDGWNTEADGSGDAYAAGDSIMLDGDLILYAQWTPDARITYHPGFRGVGGRDDYAPVGELYTVKDEIWALVYSDPVYVPRPYSFDYWNTDFNGAGASYDPGDTFVVTGDIVLYALWYRIT